MLEHEIHFASPEQWWEWKWSFSLRGVLEQLAEASLDTLRTAMLSRAARADELSMRLRAWSTTGTLDVAQ